jgi:hypothetical protein
MKVMFRSFGVYKCCFPQAGLAKSQWFSSWSTPHLLVGIGILVPDGNGKM